MLGFFEKRKFLDGEKIWLGSYRNLTNVLHWHFECEVIRIVEGNAKIKIGDATFDATRGDCFFCGGEELHSIVCEKGALVDVAIFDETLFSEITEKYTVISPKLPNCISVEKYFFRIKEEIFQKNIFYRQAIENQAKELLLDIFRRCPIRERHSGISFHKNLIDMINRDFSFITFEDAVRYSGYSSSHFSKMFKKITGMNFSEYLNIVKVENAIILLQHNDATMTSISQKCGFATIRNFNRVFKKITGFSPRSLPKNFVIDTGLRISETDLFDPTDKASVLV